NLMPIKHCLWRQDLLRSSECRLPLTRVSEELARELDGVATGVPPLAGEPGRRGGGGGAGPVPRRGAGGAGARGGRGRGCGGGWSRGRLVPKAARLMATRGKMTSHGAFCAYSAAAIDSIRPQDG